MRVTIRSGPYAGRTREIPPGIDPMDLLTEMARANFRWEVHYLGESPEAVLRWGRADLVARVLGALWHGRPVWFLGVEYRARTRADVPGVAGAIEDAIVNSGLYVTVESDDGTGVRIGVGPVERQTRN